MIKGIIFDLDGTTLDTLQDLHNAVNKVMVDFNLPLQSLEEVRLHTGSGTKMLVKRSLPSDISEEDLDKAVKLFIKYYGENYYQFSKPYPGVKELIDELLKTNIQVGINSNKIDAYCKHLIQINFPGIDQNLVLGKKEGQKVKPDPANNFELISKMGLKKEEILYVGDSEVDIKTARNTGVKAITVSWGFRASQALELDKPDYVINEPKDLLTIIKKENENVGI